MGLIHLPLLFSKGRGTIWKGCGLHLRKIYFGILLDIGREMTSSKGLKRHEMPLLALPLLAAWLVTKGV